LDGLGEVCFFAFSEAATVCALVDSEEEFAGAGLSLDGTTELMDSSVDKVGADGYAIFFGSVGDGAAEGARLGEGFRTFFALEIGDAEGCPGGAIGGLLAVEVALDTEEHVFADVFEKGPEVIGLGQQPGEGLLYPGVVDFDFDLGHQ